MNLSRAWAYFRHLNMQLFLSLMFFGVITPVAIVRRLLVAPRASGWVSHSNALQPSSGAMVGFLGFLRTRKRYWLLPIVTLMFVLGILLVLSEGAAIAPFIYTLF